ncbi:cupin domain-containing protein [Sedimentitalea sp. JM2-8]|uniref:Cupin domain-containing protein n=1 Tax=Sedimentitalea xiamensis TaxID=3050037 RepID=A0ABT7FFA4_9RHOB|nr:cupin domain-containing protein [Sedimentitalea xiamensis]MDK3073806.1 cupin domain-containing protein [Sedimentitalea xiamensis]
MTRHIIDLNADAKTVQTRRLADEEGRVLEGDPEQKIALHYSDGSGRLRVGQWISTPGKWRAFTNRDEYCYILSGRCALIHEDGTRREFTAGSSFLIPDGFRGYWEVMETTEKHFVILTRDED